MKKKIVIESCGACPESYLYDSLHGFWRHCILLGNKDVKSKGIDPECPLEDEKDGEQCPN